jgi:pimeloyl-ACP methyl ester carboxylesterase
VPRITVNDVELEYQVRGDGPPVVLVHGSWTDHTSWELVVPELACEYRVVTYDRRGHSASERPITPASRRTEEADLVALLEALQLTPAHLVGNSYGGSICLGVATRRPDVVRSVAAHEPPLLDAVRDDLHVADDIAPLLDLVASLLAADEQERGAATFVDAVLGEGVWAALPDNMRRTMIANSSTFLAMLDDPGWAAVPSSSRPVPPILLSQGSHSPKWFHQIVAALSADAFRDAQLATLAGAGHAPHLTHSTDYVATLQRFFGAPTHPC